MISFLSWIPAYQRVSIVCWHFGSGPHELYSMYYQKFDEDTITYIRQVILSNLKIGKVPSIMR